MKGLPSGGPFFVGFAVPKDVYPRSDIVARGAHHGGKIGFAVPRLLGDLIVLGGAPGMARDCTP